jgi:hypothetical protein
MRKSLYGNLEVEDMQHILALFLMRTYGMKTPLILNNLLISLMGTAAWLLVLIM